MLSIEEILADFKSFYYETALSAYETNLLAMERFVGPGHILFGTDCPAVSAEMAGWYTQNLQNFYANEPDKLNGIMYENALKLFPSLRRTALQSSL
jgi:predicted TIM-barrel fold metal-dependent hydrolase